MKLPLSYVQKAKTVFHAFQALLIFIAWAITIAVFRGEGKTDGRTAWFFALCWFSIPALIYLVMVPKWPRVQRFANAYAFLAVDGIYTIFWFSAFISVATWTSSGIRTGAIDKKKKESEGNCTTFKYGSETKCKLSQATIGFGIVIFLLFALTTSISTHNLLSYRKSGILPIHASSASHQSTSENPTTALEAQTKDAFSNNINDEEDEYALLHSTDQPGRRPSGRGEYETAHQGDYENGYENGYGEGGGRDNISDGALPPKSRPYAGDPFANHAETAYRPGARKGAAAAAPYSSEEQEEDFGYRGAAAGGVRYSS